MDTNLMRGVETVTLPLLLTLSLSGAVGCEHKYCRVDDLFGNGHPPDTVVAMALAYHAFRTGRQPGDYGVTI